jgi:hypothetical protein
VPAKESEGEETPEESNAARSMPRIH